MLDARGGAAEGAAQALGELAVEEVDRVRPQRLGHAERVRAQAGVGAARRGEATAFRAIFDRHAPRVCRFLRDVLGDGVAAEEATQETFVRAHAALASLAESDRLSPWLFGIARNVQRELQRARARVVPLWACLALVAATVLMFAVGSVPWTSALWTALMVAGMAPAAVTAIRPRGVRTPGPALQTPDHATVAA